MERKGGKKKKGEGGKKQLHLAHRRGEEGRAAMSICLRGVTDRKKKKKKGERTPREKKKGNA